MRKVFYVLILIASSLLIAGVCKEGNEPMQPLDCYPNCPPEAILCCVKVGDGSALSCTDGQDWWCLGNCAEETL